MLKCPTCPILPYVIHMQIWKGDTIIPIHKNFLSLMKKNLWVFSFLLGKHTVRPGYDSNMVQTTDFRSMVVVMSQTHLSCISAFWIPCNCGAWWKNIHSLNLVETAHGAIRYVSITVMNQSKLVSVGLIRYSCKHISGHHELIHVRFGGFAPCSTEIIKVMEMLKCKIWKFDDVTLQFSITTILQLTILWKLSYITTDWCRVTLFTH